MDPLSVTASIVAVLQLSATVLGYLNDVKDASKDRAKCAVEASNVHSLLLNLRFRLEEGSADAPWYTAVRALNIENGPLDQFKQALEALQAKMTDGGRLKKVGEALVWKFKKEEIASILDRIERLKTLVEIALQMDHFKLSQAIKDDTSFVRTHVPAIQSGVDKIQQDQADAKHSKMVEWISPTDYPAQQSDIIGRRQEETGQWFLDAPKFARWLGEPKGTLFCPGIPGAGKTMVAAIAIDHLLKSVKSSSVGVAYVYCNYKAQEEQDASSMLAAIVKQLVQARPSTAEPVERLHKQHAGRGTKPSLEEIFSALQEVLAKYSTVHIVVDALDECRNSDGTRSQFLAKLRDLQAGQDVRLITTSRFIPEIEVEFREAEKLEVRASDADVRRFVAGQMYRLPKCIQRDLALQVMVQDKIVEAVDGMFLLARLHVDSLLDKTTAKKVKTTLANLSKGSAALDDAYKDALQRIESQLGGHYDLAKKVLSWITYATRPLTTAEICCVISVEPEDEELDPENVPDVEDLVSVCAGLVVVDEGSAIIRLVHYTTQEYFERIRDEWNPSAQLNITSTCLTYLSFGTFRSGSRSSNKGFEERLRQSEFLDYAAKHWGKHILTVQDEVYRRARLFLLHNGYVSCAAQVMLVPDDKYGYYSQNYPKRTTGLHLTARFGLSSLTQALLCELGIQATIAINRKDSRGQTPLYLAVQYGHYGIVKLLLDRGADVNAQGGECGHALQAALEGGHEQIVKLLLDQGTDVNAQGGWMGNALQVASGRGDGQSVKLLLSAGADVNVRGGIYGNALQAASAGGHEQIVKLLLNQGADVNAQGGTYGNALQASLVGGDEQVVKLLLDHGADVNAQGGSYGNALQAASAKGHEEIVKLLLNQGAEINVEGQFYDNALQAASMEGHEQIVKLLLDRGADANDEGAHRDNALQKASYSGHEQVVKLLLDHGADVNAQSKHLGGGAYHNALQVASAEGHEQIVKLLLDHGANVNAQVAFSNFDGKCFSSTALEMASIRGHEQIVKLLLDQGANVNAPGGSYGNALQAASKTGYKEIVKLLLSHGADVKAKDRQRGNALPKASVAGYEEIVKLLLDHGADVNAEGLFPMKNLLYSGNALQAASIGGHEQIVKLLLDQGADINAQVGCFGNALQAASIGGNEQVAKLLLDQGANVSVQGGQYGNALQGASYRGYKQVVRLLLDHGANVNTQGGGYGNALQAASAGGDEQTVKLLLDHGADVNAQGGSYGNTLQAASAEGHEEIIKLLLNQGANINAQGGTYGNALQAASIKGHEQIVKLLLDQGADVNAQGGQMGNALQAASEAGNELIVELLLDHGANVNAQGGTYGNALQAASAEGHEEIVKLLLNQGADVNAQGEEYDNALQAASAEGHEEIVKLLLNQGADVNAQGEEYDNALHAASEGGHKQIVKLLLNQGADVNAQGGRYGNALQAACYRGHEPIVKLLLNEGANLNTQGEGVCSWTPLQIAARGGHIDTFQYLVDLGLDLSTLDAKGDGVLCYASSAGSLDVLQAALNCGLTFSSESMHWTPLHWACRSGKPEVVELLIKKGVRSDYVTIPEPQGQWSPLDITIFHGNEEMLEKLSSSCRALLGPETDTARSPGTLHHGYTCDGCLHDIYGPRSRCRICPGLDYCFMCKPFLGSLHIGHEWEVFESNS